MRTNGLKTSGGFATVRASNSFTEIPFAMVASWIVSRRSHGRDGTDCQAPDATISYGTCLLFCAVAAATVVGIPLYGYHIGFTRFDWIHFFVMYIMTGMGITVGYHRLVAHQSFDCPAWVNRLALVVGGWALQNLALV